MKTTFFAAGGHVVKNFPIVVKKVDIDRCRRRNSATQKFLQTTIPFIPDFFVTGFSLVSINVCLRQRIIEPK